MDTNPSFEIAWNLPGSKTRLAHLAPRTEAFGMQASVLGAQLALEDGLWHLYVQSSQDVYIGHVSATLSLDLAHADTIYLNGYNSWTDSWERDPNGRMRGLWGMPRHFIDKWTLDSSGDYRFVRQDFRRGHQHGVGYGYLRRDRDVMLFGEAAPDTGVTAIYEDYDAGTVTLEKEGPARLVAAGERLELFTLAVLEGGLDEVVRRFVALMGRAPRPARPLVGYSSWYRHFGAIDEQAIQGDLEGVARVLLPRRREGVDLVFQIDDGYAKVGDWTSPDAGKFPRGLAPLAAAISGQGLVPGLWMAPFVCEKDSRLFTEHPDWLLRGPDGRPVSSGSHWSGGFALDTRVEGVREHVRTSLHTAAATWGFRLLKLDFLYAAAMLPHDGLNRGQLMADALDLLRSAVPEGTLFDLCGVPLMNAIGRCEYCRIGCDVGLDWNDVPHMWIINRERISTKRSLHNTLGRAHLDGVAFANDPDVFFLRDDVKIREDQRERLLAADAAHGSMLLTSDDMGAWTDGQLARFDEALDVFYRRAGHGGF